MNQLDSAEIDSIVQFTEAAKLPYAIVGGLAVIARGYPRFTTDIDLVALVDDQKITELLEVAAQFGITPRTQNVLQMAKQNRMLLLQTGAGTGIDVSMGALPFEEECIASATPFEYMPGKFANCINFEALLVMKAVAWRPQDQTDISQLVKVQPRFDRRYVIRTFAEFAEILEVPERVQELEQLLDKAAADS